LKTKPILILFFCTILLGFASDNGDNKFYHIPARTIDFSKQWGYERYQFKFKTSIEEFDISSLVTYSQYKTYLKDIKVDSSTKFYQSQLPDTGMCNKDVYEKYVSSSEYDTYPVLGITWEAAMNYCKWMTLKENKDSLVYMYCLPTYTQWIDAYEYLKSINNTGDLNNDYSDWLLTPNDEGTYFIKNEVDSNSTTIAYLSLNDKTDAPVLRRKMIAGNSFLFLLDYSMNYYYHYYGYSDRGYRQVGFRYVKHKIRWPVTIQKPAYMVGKYDYKVLQYWGLKKSK